MSSIHPNDSRCKMNSAEEIASGLVVARGNAAVLPEPAEKVLDQMAGFVQMRVVWARLLARAARWNHDILARFEQRLDDTSLCMVGLVGDHNLSCSVPEQHVGTLQIVGLAGRQVKIRRIAQRIDRGANLGAQPSSAEPNG